MKAGKICNNVNFCLNVDLIVQQQINRSIQVQQQVHTHAIAIIIGNAEN